MPAATAPCKARNRSPFLPMAKFALRGLQLPGSVTPMNRKVLIALPWALLLAACAGDAPPAAPATADGLARYPEAQDQIVAYYASQGAGEPRFACGRGRIEALEGSRIVTDTPVEVVFEVTYRFTATALGAGAGPCSGANTRWFTFDREGDGKLSLAEMADEAP